MSWLWDGISSYSAQIDQLLSKTGSEVALFYLNVFLKIRDAKDVEAVVRGLQEMAPQCRLEDGCERWEAYHSDEDSNQVLLVERWTTKGHWEKHLQAPTITEIYRKKILPLVERQLHPGKFLG